MSYTNAELVRRLAGDRGIFSHDMFSGDGSTTTFYLKGHPILGSSYTVRVGGTIKTETTDYTLDTDTGELVMASAPAAGTDNVAVVYRAVELSDADITEALRQRSLTDSATADVGPASAMLLAAADILDIRWADWVAAYDVSMDGESLSRSQAASALRDKAQAYRTQARQAAGVTAAPVTVVDGYNYNDVDSESVQQSNINVRRRFYGEEDRIP